MTAGLRVSDRSKTGRHPLGGAGAETATAPEKRAPAFREPALPANDLSIGPSAESSQATPNRQQDRNT